MTLRQSITDSGAGTQAGGSQAGEIIHRSPGITAIYNELKSSRRNNILDLGSSSGKSFEFFSTLSCHIHFEGVDAFLAESSDAWMSGAALRAGLDDYLSEFGEGKKFDIILAWDILNYLDRETLHWLVVRLNRYCHANTLLHCLKYVGRNLSASPRHYQIIDQYSIKMSDPGTLCSRPFPSLDTNTTLKSMPGYSMEHTFMQQEGMAPDVSEHVLRYRPDEKTSKRQMASAELSRATELLPHAALPHRSYALENICAGLRGLQNATVLDLGSKATHSGDFLLEYAEKVYVEDILPSLVATGAAGEASHIRQHALRYQADVKFDVILAWDLFNFCTRAQLAAIHQKLEPHLHSETKIFAFFYNGAELPDRPQKCYVLDEKNIALLPAPGRKAAGEDLTAVALLKVFHEFHLANTYILRPGMHRGVYEYIFQSSARVSAPDSAVKGV